MAPFVSKEKMDFKRKLTNTGKSQPASLTLENIKKQTSVVCLGGRLMALLCSKFRVRIFKRYKALVQNLTLNVIST